MTQIKTVYGPYIENGRRFVILYYEDGAKKKTAYARHRWEEAFGPIPEGMEVDHIDENPLNDEMSNYQLLTRLENQIKGGNARAGKMRTLVCGVCNTIFEKREYRIRENEKLGIKNFCGRRCAGTFNRQKQLDGAAAMGCK